MSRMPERLSGAQPKKNNKGFSASLSDSNMDLRRFDTYSCFLPRKPCAEESVRGLVCRKRKLNSLNNTSLR